MDKRTLKLLYRSLDSPLNPKEQRRLEAALAGSEELRRRREKIIALRQALADGATRSFRPGFADRTLERLRSAPASGDRWLAVLRNYAAAFKPVAIVGLILLAVLVSYNLANRELMPKDAIFYASDLAVGRLLHPPVF